MASLSQMLGGKKNQDVSEVLFSALFGKKKKPAKKTTPAQVKTTSSSGDESQVAILRSIAANARISAKNSMALPSILSQTNIMQKNIAKLVRIQGSSPTTKADNFFSSSKFRENAYEATYRKNLISTSPTKAEPEKKQSIFSSLFSSIGGAISSFFAGGLLKLVIGGVLLTGLGKYFSDPEFKEKVNNILGSIRDAIFSSEGWANFKKGVIGVGLVLLGLKASIIAVQIAMNVLAARMWASGGRPMPPVGVPGRNRTGLPGTRGRFSRAALGLALAGFAGEQAYSMYQDFTAPTGTSPENMGTDPQSNAPSPQDLGPNQTSPEQTAPEQKSTNWTNIALNAVQLPFAMSLARQSARDLAARGMRMSPGLVLGLEKKAATKWISIIGKFRTKGWGPRLIAKLQIKLARSALGKRIMKRAIAFVVGAVIPGPGWVMAVINGLMFLWDCYWILDILYSIYTELEKEDLGGNQAVSAAKTDDSSGPTNTGGSSSSIVDTAIKTLTAAALPMAAPGIIGSMVSNMFPSSGLGKGATLSELKGVRDSTSAQEAMKFFQSKGWTKEQAAGIVGNLIQESGLKTDAYNAKENAYGIAQWRAPRQADFRKAFGKDLREANINEQLEFVNWELNNTHKDAGKALRNTTTASDAAYVVDKQYEVSAGTERKKRMDFANTLAATATVAEKSPPAAQKAPAAPPATTPKPNNSGASPLWNGGAARPAEEYKGMPDYLKKGAPAVIDASTTNVIGSQSGSPPPSAQAIPVIHNPELGPLLLKNEYLYG